MNNVFEVTYEDPEDADDDPVPTKTKRCIQSATAFVLGGNETDRHEFPHMALLGDSQAFSEPVWFCGGSLISANYILTAAHCKSGEVTRKGTKKRVTVTTARLGTHTVSNPEAGTRDVKVLRFYPHEDYNTNLKYNDIALVQLEQDAPLSPNIRPICLPKGNVQYKPKEALATGWGRVDFEGDSSDVLRKVDLPFVARSECQRLFNDHLPSYGRYQLKSSQICYGGVKDKDTCQGDSGGPLQSNNPDVFCSYTIYGVTSIGIECGQKLPALYTNVVDYLDWIEKNVWPNEHL